MFPVLKRRRFLQASLAAAASIGVSNLRASAFGTEEQIEAIVIGSGFGGAVASLRLGQAITKPEGYLSYNASTKSADLFWPSNSANNQKNAQAFEYTYQLLNQANGTTLAQSLDFSSTAHPLGGATISAVCNTYGQVHGYRNLFVVDGSLIPGSTACTNPSLTIAALAERCMDRFLNRPRSNAI